MVELIVGIMLCLFVLPLIVSIVIGILLWVNGVFNFIFPLPKTYEQEREERSQRDHYVDFENITTESIKNKLKADWYRERGMDMEAEWHENKIRELRKSISRN